MSPREVENEALYHDRTVQDWHRATFPTSHWAIDLDLMGACNRCRRPLYLIESTTNPEKPTSILRNLAEMAHVPAFVIRHNTSTITGARRVWPRPESINAAVIADHLKEIRTVHLPQCNPGGPF